jgi:hypothetical protein
VRNFNPTRNIPTFRELVASIPCSQEFTVGVYCGPVQFILCLQAVSKKAYKVEALVTVLDNSEAENPTLVGCRPSEDAQYRDVEVPTDRGVFIVHSVVGSTSDQRNVET